MPPKRKTSSSASSSSYSSSSSSTNCDTIPTIKQRFGTCWFNAILTCLLYGDKSKKLFRRKLNKQQFPKLIKIYDDKIEKTEEDESYMQKTFKLFSAKQSLQDVQELFLKIIAYTEQTNIDFDLAIHLLIALNSYDSNIFTIQPIADEQNSHIFAVCPPNIHMQVKYSLNIYKMFGIKALVIQKTLKKKDYKGKCILFDYKLHTSNTMEYDDTPDVIIVVDAEKEISSAIIETLKHNDKYYSLDSIKFCNVIKPEQQQIENLHAISCIKCKKKYYISDTICNRLLPIDDISNKEDWYIKKENRPDSINCSEIVYDTAKDKMLFNIYEGSTRKIFFYLKTRSQPAQHSVIYKQEDSMLLVPSSIFYGDRL